MIKPTQDNWESHWTNFGTLTEENPADKYRYDMILKALDLPGKGEGCRVLDIGCGDGSFIRILKNRFPNAGVIGVDSSNVGLNNAGNKTPGVEFICVDLNQDETGAPAELKNWSTHAVCSEVIEHLDYPKEFLRRSSQLMGRDSCIVVTVPGGPMAEFHRHVGHRTHFTAQTISRLLEESGLRVERVFRAGFPFFNVYRIATQLRGKRLIQDLNVGGGAAGGPIRRSFALRSAFLALKPLLKLNLDDFPVGWQLLVRARVSPKTR